jgi:hypothetical protein
VPSWALDASTYATRDVCWSSPLVPAAEPVGPTRLADDYAAARNLICTAAVRAGFADLPTDIGIGDPAALATTWLADPPTWSHLGQPQPRVLADA